MSARDKVHYNGIYWKDIDWTKPIHVMEVCDYCGSDAAEGHQNACMYLFKNQESPAGRDFLREQIRNAVMRERKAGNDVLPREAARRHAARAATERRTAMTERFPDALELAILAGTLNGTYGDTIIYKGPDRIPAKDKKWSVGMPARDFEPKRNEGERAKNSPWFVAARPYDIDVHAMERCVEEGWISPYGGPSRRITAAGFEAAVSALRAGHVPEGWSESQADAVLDNTEANFANLRNRAFGRPKGAEPMPTRRGMRP